MVFRARVSAECGRVEIAVMAVCACVSPAILHRRSRLSTTRPVPVTVPGAALPSLPGTPSPTPPRPQLPSPLPAPPAAAVLRIVCHGNEHAGGYSANGE